VCIHSPFGAQVHAPWAIALRARLAERWGAEPELLWSDDGIVVRLPAAVDELPLDDLTIPPEQIDELVVTHLPSTAMFASRFRECAARALLLPRRRPDQRTPLWQQRQRAADLLQVASQFPTFPILLETTRECCNDVFDLPALRQVLADIRARRVRVVAVDTPRASPMAQSLLFGWIAVYMYEYDAPLAERRAAALALDRDLLRELLGAEELRELIDPAVLADLELDLQRLTDGRRARDPDEVHDLLRTLGPLTRAEIDLRSVSDPSPWIDELLGARRAIAVAVAGEARIAASEDAARLRDALGVAIPLGLPAAFTDPVDDPLGDLVARFARTHGPFLAGEVATRYGVDIARVLPALERLLAGGQLVRGEFRPEGVQREWCDDDVLRQLRRRSLAALRREVEPVDANALARFLPKWQGVGVPRRGLDGLVVAVGVLQGAPIPASVLEPDVLAARMNGYRAADLDALCTAGEVVWIGAGALGATDGRVALFFRDQVAALAPEPGDTPSGPVHAALLAHLERRGASFWPDLVRAAGDAGTPYDEPTVLAALWDLVWAGLVTNDSFAPVRALLGGRPKRAAPPGRRPRPGRLTRLGPPAAAGRWSLVDWLVDARPEPTVAAHARAGQLLERYGVLTREAAVGEGAPGGFAGVYPVLTELENRGQIRRGYFVAGLGAAQFALPGAVDRLREVRAESPDDEPLVVATTDPAQPYGASLPWPESAVRPARAAGAFVVLHHGEPLAYLERGARAIGLFPGAATNHVWADALARLVKNGRLRSLEIAKVDGQPVREHPDAAAQLRAAGFVDCYRGLGYRP
jgi:ATP-dependent Lhr-like helicase